MYDIHLRTHLLWTTHPSQTHKESRRFRKITGVSRGAIIYSPSPKDAQIIRVTLILRFQKHFLRFARSMVTVLSLVWVLYGEPVPLLQKLLPDSSNQRLVPVKVKLCMHGWRIGLNSAFDLGTCWESRSCLFPLSNGTGVGAIFKKKLYLTGRA